MARGRQELARSLELTEGWGLQGRWSACHHHIQSHQGHKVEHHGIMELWHLEGKHLLGGLLRQVILFQTLKKRQGRGDGEEGLQSFAQDEEMARGPALRVLGICSPFLCGASGEVVRSQVGWQGHAGRSPGPEDHMPGLPLLRPATGMFQEIAQ